MPPPALPAMLPLLILRPEIATVAPELTPKMPNGLALLRRTSRAFAPGPWISMLLLRSGKADSLYEQGAAL